MNEEIRWLWEHSGMKSVELAKIDPDAPTRARKYGFLRIAQNAKNAHTLAIGAGKHWSIGPCPLCMTLTENDCMDRHVVMCSKCARAQEDYDVYTPEGKARWGSMGKDQRVKHLMDHDGKSMGQIYDSIVGFVTYESFVKWIGRHGFVRNHGKRKWDKVPCASCGFGSDADAMAKDRLCGSCLLVRSNAGTLDRPLTFAEEREASKRRRALNPDRILDKRHPLARKYANLNRWMPTK